MENKDTKKDLYIQKRIALSELSRDAEKLRDKYTNDSESEAEAMFWATRTINYMLLHHMYDTGGATEFNTFKQWKEKEAIVLKGSKAFAIWGQPVHEQKKKQEDTSEQNEIDKYKYFPICYLFSNLQVITSENRNQKIEEEVKQELNEQVESLVI